MNQQTAFVAAHFQPATVANLDDIRDTVTDCVLDLWHLGGFAPTWTAGIRNPSDLAAIDWTALRDQLETQQ